MSEFKRLFGIKTAFILLALVIINVGIFMMSFATEKNITLTGDELETYISEYPEFNKYSASVVSSTVTAAKQGVVKNAANNNPNNNSLLIIPILIYLNRMFPL